MDVVTLTIDGAEVNATRGVTVLEAAQKAGIYIPRLCYHPDLHPTSTTKAEVYQGGELIKSAERDSEEFRGCRLCITEIEGIEGFPTA